MDTVIAVVGFATKLTVCSDIAGKDGHEIVKQHFSSTPRFRWLQKPKLRTYEDDKSDIGTREIRKIVNEVQ